MKDLLTPRQVAQAINMSESSLKRWCDQGLIQTVRTAGGHRRLPASGVLKFLRENGYQLVHPELLGLPASTTGGVDRKIANEKNRLLSALLDGDNSICTEVVLNFYLAGFGMSRIFDDSLMPIFQEIREQREAGTIAAYQERMAFETCQRVLHEVRRAMPEILPTAPIAIGGTLEGDSFTVASSMIELVLREGGWRACSLGAMLPFLSLRQAICDMRAKLVWLSVLTVPDKACFVTEFQSLRKMADENQVKIVIGGQALDENLRSQLKYDAECDTLSQLEEYAAQLFPPSPDAQLSL